MEFIHETVRHARFGSGTITSFDGHVITVSFETAGERVFSWPTAFSQFLTADNPALQAQADALMQVKRSVSASNVTRVEQDIAAMREASRKKPAVRRAPRKAPLPSKAQL